MIDELHKKETEKVLNDEGIATEAVNTNYRLKTNLQNMNSSLDDACFFTSLCAA